MSGARILVVDDDRAILRSVRRALEARDYRVETVESFADVEPAMAKFRPDIVLLDLVLPDGDGIEMCRRIRRDNPVPIIVLSAIGEDAKKVEALDTGADDYLTKPFSLEELLARMRVAFRHQAGSSGEQNLNAGPICLNLETRLATVGGVAVHLTPKEFELLRLLLQEQGRVLTHRMLLSRVWGPEYVNDTHILRTFIHQLRAKLDAASDSAGATISTDPGVGYRIAAPES